MNIVINFLGVEVLDITVSIPRLNLFAPGSLPDSEEAWEGLEGDE